MRSTAKVIKYLSLLILLASTGCTAYQASTDWRTSQAKSKMKPVVQIGHSAPVTSVEFSPCGRYVLSGSKDKTVKLWDIATGREIRTFKGHSDVVSSARFTPDGRYIVSSSWDRSIRLWDIATGLEVRVSEEHGYKVHAMVISRNGKYALSGSEDRSLILWNLPSCRVAKRFGGSGLASVVTRHTASHPSKIRDRIALNVQAIAKLPGSQWKPYTNGHVESVASVNLSKTGAYALSGSQDFTMRLWDVSTGDAVKVFRLPLVEFLAVAFSPDGKYALSGNSDSVLRLWKISNRKVIHELKGHSDAVSAVAFSPDGQFALSGSWDHTVNLWSISKGDVLKSFVGHTDRVNAVAFSPDGKFVLSGSDDHTLKLWDIATGQEIRTFKGHSLGVRSISLSPNEPFLLSGHNDHTLKLWDISTGRQIKVYRGHSGIVHSVIFSSDGRMALSGSSDKKIIVWDISTGRKSRILEGHTGAVKSVVLSRDNRHALSGSEDQTIKLWDAWTGDEVKSIVLDHTYKINCVALSPDGRYALVGTEGKTFNFIEMSSGRIHQSFDGHFFGVNSVSFAPNGRYALSGGGDNLIKLWDIATGQLVKSFEGHKGSIQTAIFTPDGRYILSGSEDSTLRIWDVAKGISIKTLTGHSDTVTSATSIRDLNYVISGSADASIRKWDITENSEIVRMYGSTDGEWITTAADGYYQNSTEGNNLLHWIHPGGLETFTFEQFESLFKKPDIVKARLDGNLDAGTPAPSITRPPHIEMADHLEIKETSAQNYLLKVRPSGLEEVKTVRVFVNGKPTVEVPVTFEEKELSLDVPLLSGANRITAVAYDEKGFSSNPKYVDVICKHPGLAKPNLYVFAIGISNYPRLSSRWQLEFAHTDAKSLIEGFEKQEGKLFGEVRYNLLSNKEATVQTINDVLDALSGIDENDLAVVFMAGHGVKAQDGTFYFLTSDGSFEEPQRGGLSWATVGKHLSRVKGRVILLLDACHSGSIVTETVVPNDELAQQFFTGGRAGIMVFSASKGRQYSLESPDIGGGFGIFTYALTQSLGPRAKEADINSDGFVEFMELVDYVSQYVHRETKGEQTPWLSRKELFGDLPVAVVD
ncbi:MAG: caspase family protein [Syntrophobacterales bacterium]|jgi:WD40 repeat protein